MSDIKLYLDFQGWPVQPMTLREILLGLGFEEDSETITLIKNEETNQLLDSYPRLLQDDGMGYGINKCYITEVDNTIFDEKIKGIKFGTKFDEVHKTEENITVFNMFYDNEASDEYLKDITNED